MTVGTSPDDALSEAIGLTSGPGNGTTTRTRSIEEWRRLDCLFRAARSRPVVADVVTGKPIPLVLYSDDHATDPHTHDVDGYGNLSFRYPRLPADPAATDALYALADLEAATRAYADHVQSRGCDHAPAVGTHTSCPEALALRDALDALPVSQETTDD